MTFETQTLDFLQKQLAESKADIKEAKADARQTKKVLGQKEARVAKLENTQAKIQDWIKELKEDGRKKADSPATIKPSTEPAKENVKQHHVLHACQEAVSDNPGIEVGELHSFVKHKMEDELQLGMRGYDHRFKEVMKKSLFKIIDDEHVWLAGSQPPREHNATVAPVSTPPELPVESFPESQQPG